MKNYSQLSTATLHAALRQLAEESRLSTLIEYVLIEQELKKRLDTTQPLFPSTVSA